jgi:small conductance mechanosensitive channel
MPNPFKNRRELGLDKMFETRSDAWEAVGLALETGKRDVTRAQKRSLALLPLVAGVLVVWHERHRILGEHYPVAVFRTVTSGGHPHRVFAHFAYHWSASPWDTPLQVGAVIVFIALGWALARNFGKAAGPTLMRRMDPGLAGTVGFLIRLVTVFITVLIALHVAGVSTQGLAISASFTAVIFGLAAQQTLGNVIAGMVLLSARPFRVGERVRLQAGAVGGSAEGIVSSAVVPLREPESINVKVRLNKPIRPTYLEDRLDDHIRTPTRAGRVSVLLEEVNGDEVVVRVQATPERADDGAQLADEIIGALREITRDHELEPVTAVGPG